MEKISYEDKLQYTWAKTEKENLRKLASKINKIPKEFSQIDGSLDLDKVHLKLMDYHKNAL